MTRQPKPKPQFQLEAKPVDPVVKAAAIASQKQNKEQIEKQKMEFYIAKERQEVLVFYMRNEIQAIYSDYSDYLRNIYDGLVEASDS